MGSVTGTESDSTLKMRLTPIFALILLSCLLLNLTNAQRSLSRKTTKNNNCRGSSSRPSSSRSSSSRPSSSRGRDSTGGRGSAGCRPNNQKPTTPRPTTPSGTSGSSRKPWRNLPKKKKKKTTSETSDSSVPPTDEEGDSVISPDEDGGPVSSPDEERDSNPNTKKAAAKKYLGKVKDKLQSAAIWYLENKDKTIDDILVDKWKKKCPGGISTKKKRKQCVSDALADSDDDTPEEKEIKDALKSLVEEDSDGAYDFLSKSSSRTFGDIENEEEIQDKLSEMPEKYEKLWEEDKSKTFTELESEFEREKAEKMSKLSNDIKAVFSKVGGQISTKIRSWSRSCTKKSQTTQSRKCQNEAGRDGQKKQKCREAQSARRRSCLEEVFEPTPEDSLQDRNIKADLEELTVQDPETGTQLVESCQIPETIRSKRSPGVGGLSPAAPALPAASCLAVRGARPRNRNTDQRTVIGKIVFGNIFRTIKAEAAPFLTSQTPTYTTIDPPKATKDFIDLLGKAKLNGISKGKPVALNDENNFFVNGNTVLGTGPLPPNFDPTGFWHDSGKHTNDVTTGYQEFESDDDFEYLQVNWIQDRDPVSGNIIFENGREKGHFEVTPMEGKITIGVLPGPPEKVTHLAPAIGEPQREIGNTLKGNDPFTHVGPKASNINKGKGAM